MAKLKKIKVFQLAKLNTILAIIVGLIAGILYSFGGLIIDAFVTLGWVTTTETPGLSYGTVLAFGALIGMPIVFAAYAFVLILVGGFIYNLFAKRFGGIEIDFK